MTENCLNCIYSSHIDKEFYSGYCRKHAPSLVLKFRNNPQNFNGESQYVITQFPETKGDNWCGDFKQKSHE